MITLARIVPVAVGVGILLFALSRKKKRKSKSVELPSDSCGLYPWLPHEVDEAVRAVTDTGERYAETIALAAARDVYPTTPEGEAQAWPPHPNDARALCILDRIRIRVNLILAQIADDDADDDDDPGTFDPGIAPPPGTCPEGWSYDADLGKCIEPFEPGIKPFEDPDPEWPDYPDPAPVNLTEWTDPENYPTPGKFHQIGGKNSGTTLKKISRLALTTAFYLVHNDLELADTLARRSENWRAYRQLINCSPWNHLLFGAPNDPDSIGYYNTPHNESISLFPVHDSVRVKLSQGKTPERRVRDNNRAMPKGGKHAFLWLPPLDEAELANAKVIAKKEHWETGDWVIMPPPEVMSLGIETTSSGRTWGCDGWATEWYEENPGGRRRFRYAPKRDGRTR